MAGYPNEMNTLVSEMGFNHIEAQMALEEAKGNVSSAIEKLTSGQYAPPPYDHVGETSQTLEATSNEIIEKNRLDNHTELSFSNIWADIRGKHNAPVVEDHPTAPSFFDLTNDLNQIHIQLPETAKMLPPPYQIVNKTQKVQKWEKDSNVFYFNDKINSPSNFSSATGQSQNTSFLGNQDRCDVCFNVLTSPEDILSQNNKVCTLILST